MINENNASPKLIRYINIFKQTLDIINIQPTELPVNGSFTYNCALILNCVNYGSLEKTRIQSELRWYQYVELEATKHITNL